MDEEFVPIRGFEDRYSISRQGEVYSKLLHRTISPMKMCGRYNSGYSIYRLLHSDGTYEYRSLRHILAEAFLSDYQPGCEIHIIDKRKPITSDNIEISKTAQGHVIHTRCRVQCVETGKCYESLSELSRELCGDNHLKGHLSSSIHKIGKYKGMHYIILE